MNELTGRCTSDSGYPDEKDFYVLSPDIDYYDWYVDFNQNVIELTYTSIEAKGPDHQYMYDTARGFHFHDSENSLPEIINVIVDDTFAPSGFDSELVTFDADNIYVNLRGSRCLNQPMVVLETLTVIPECNNSGSPTGYNNQIKLKVEFAGGEAVYEETLDKLYDWGESKYPEVLPTHQESMDIIGYYARFYPESGVYVGSLGGRLYVYGAQFGGMLELGKVSYWVEKMELDAKKAVDEATLNQLYGWAESKYPEYFPTHQESMDIIGYYARFYPESGVYIGSLEGSLYVYGTQFGGLLELGKVSYWVEQMEAEEMDNM